MLPATHLVCGTLLSRSPSKVRTTLRIRVDPISMEQPLAGLGPRQKTREKLLAAMCLTCKCRRARDSEFRIWFPHFYRCNGSARKLPLFYDKGAEKDYGKSKAEGTLGQPKPFRPGDWRLVTNRHQTARAARSVEAFQHTSHNGWVVLEQDRCPQTSRHPCCRSTIAIEDRRSGFPDFSFSGNRDR